MSHRYDFERFDDEEEEDEKEEKGEGLSKKMMDFFLESRTILIFEGINPKMTSRVIAQLLFLNTQDTKKEIKIFINSPGGHVDDGLAIFDLIQLVDAPVKTIVCGLAASAASLILVAAKKENRLALPHSRIMIHQPLGGARGPAKDIEISTREIVRLRELLNGILAKETGQPLDKITTDTNRDHWFNTDEALKYGMISKVIEKLSAI